MNKSLVTTIIPNYNGAEYISRCLTSIEQQTYPSNIIVVDNGSTDDSAQIIRRDHPDVELICLPDNTGFANAVNVGIMHTSSDYVFLFNNDAIAERDALERLVRFMDRHHKAYGAQCRMMQLGHPELIDDAGDLYTALGWAIAPGKDVAVCKKEDIDSGALDTAYEAAQDNAVTRMEVASTEPDFDGKRYTGTFRTFSVCAGAALYRKEILDEIGLFDEAHFCYLEDIDLSIRARIYGYKSYVVGGAVCYHAGSATSGSRHNAFKVRLAAANSIYLIYKNQPLLQILINLPFIVLGLIIKQGYFIKKHLGMAYFEGILTGFSKIRKNRGKHVGFRAKRLSNYLAIQLDMWAGCIHGIIRR